MSPKRKRKTHTTNIYITPFNLLSPFQTSLEENDNYCYVTPKKREKDRFKRSLQKTKTKSNEQKDFELYELNMVLKKIKKS